MLAGFPMPPSLQQPCQSTHSSQLMPHLPGRAVVAAASLLFFFCFAVLSLDVYPLSEGSSLRSPAVLSPCCTTCGCAFRAPHYSHSPFPFTFRFQSFALHPELHHLLTTWPEPRSQPKGCCPPVLQEVLSIPAKIPSISRIEPIERQTAPPQARGSGQ